MKPKTKLEKTVATYSMKLPPLNDNQIAWIKRNAIPAIAYRSKKTTWCTACGKVFASNNDIKRCPNCNAKFKEIENRPRKIKCREKMYTTIISTYKGFQYARHFLVTRISRKGQNTEWDISEVVQIWINERGEQTIMARNRCMNVFYYDLWNMYSPLSIKHINKKYYGNIYEISSFSNRICNILPVLKRNGFDGKFHGCTPTELFKILLNEPLAEMLLKTRQYALLRYISYGYRIDCKHAINICNRNNYIVKDASMWIDHIKLLEQLGYDTHNAKYVCPKDLNTEHNRFLKIMHRKEEKRKFEENLANAKKRQKAYKKAKGKYFGIKFSNDKIQIAVIKSVKDILAEGIAMHHCVYAAKYYEKKESLILSAKDKDGKRLETIEYSLKLRKIIQSRGLMNKPSEMHDEIIALFNEKFQKAYSKVLQN